MLYQVKNRSETILVNITLIWEDLAETLFISLVYAVCVIPFMSLVISMGNIFTLK